MDILLIEDDLETARYVSGGLQARQHNVEIAADGDIGLARSTAGKWDLLIVDRVLPKLDGLDLVRAVRLQNQETPVLFLTGLASSQDRSRGLEAGGDDYLVKPFAFAELVARVEALGQRRHSGRQAILSVADLELDTDNQTVRRAGRAIELSHRDFLLLECLMRHAGQTVTRKMLLETVWNFDFDPKTNIIEPQIVRLRQAIDTGAEVELIRTVGKIGYCVRSA